MKTSKVFSWNSLAIGKRLSVKIPRTYTNVMNVVRKLRLRKKVLKSKQRSSIMETLTTGAIKPTQKHSN